MNAGPIPNPQPERTPIEPTVQPPDLSALRLGSIHERQHLSQIERFARTPPAGASFAEWLAALPGFLGVNRLRAVVEAIVAARRASKPVVFAMGGHVVKVGCGPVVIDLMRRGLVTAIACNGATAIHDTEIAMIGATSEDVGDTIRDGRFGMVRETAEFFAEAARLAGERQCGYGRAIGGLIREKQLPHRNLSILAAAAELDLPATVHVAIGTDTVHMPACADGALIGSASLADFRMICGVVARMGGRADEPGGVWCNVGSAVLLPEVFLKAVSISRNLGAELDALTAVNIDQLRHYRPAQNVVSRPVRQGRGFDLAGQHEILLPLLRQAVLEKIS
ncbi:MAG: hypothetical protein HRF43_19620 [Phycisphaerae bacterium]